MPFAIYAAREADAIAAACARVVWSAKAPRRLMDPLNADEYVTLADLPDHLFGGDLFANNDPSKLNGIKSKCMRPAPVYVATMANGDTVRLSFWQETGKPLDLARGRRLAQLHGVTMVPREMQQYAWADCPYGHAYRPTKAVPVLRGHAEVNGTRVDDLAWSQAPDAEMAPTAPAKRRRGPSKAQALENRLVAALAALVLECEGRDSPALSEAMDALAAAGATVAAALEMAA